MPYPYNITQPDGSRFEVQDFGQDFTIYTMTLDGYLIRRCLNESRGWCYLNSDSNGSASISTYPLSKSGPPEDVRKNKCIVIGDIAQRNKRTDQEIEQMEGRPKPPPDPNFFTTSRNTLLKTGETWKVAVPFGFLSQMELTPSEDVIYFTASIRDYGTGLHGLYPKHPIDAYRYFYFLAGPCGLSEAHFRFSIEKNWAQQSNASNLRLALYRDMGWIGLPTEKKGENATHIFFEGIYKNATTLPGGFVGERYFAIGNVSEPEVMPAQKPPSNPSKPVSTNGGFLVSTTIISMVIAGLLHLRRRKPH